MQRWMRLQGLDAWGRPLSQGAGNAPQPTNVFGNGGYRDPQTGMVSSTDGGMGGGYNPALGADAENGDLALDGNGHSHLYDGVRGKVHQLSGYAQAAGNFAASSNAICNTITVFSGQDASGHCVGVGGRVAAAVNLVPGSWIAKGAKIIGGSAKGLGRGRYVYRALAEGEALTMKTHGLSARAPGVFTEPLSHVAGKRQSWYISTTKNFFTAVGKFNKGHGVVRIDLRKVSSEIVDLSGGIPNSGRLHFYAKSDAEVLIKNHVPANAITHLWGF